MDLVELEKLTKNYVDTKNKKDQLYEKSMILRKKIVKILESNHKRQIALNEYSLELKKRKSKKLNRDKIYEMLENGLLPKSVILQETETTQLFVETRKNIELVGNKFTIKRKK